MASGWISSRYSARCSARWRSVVRRDQRGWRGSDRWLPGGSLPGVRPGVGRWFARIDVVGVDPFGSSGRISSRYSIKRRPRFCRNRRGRCGRCGRCGSARWLPGGSLPGTRSRGGRGSAGIGAAGADLIDGFRLDLLQAFGQVAVGGSPELARLVWSARICSAAAKIETNGDKKAGILSVGIRAISYYNCPVINVDSSVYY